ncbi:MAG: hypothetical protein Q7U54_06220 [Bacteroidales bacterium]|nr:hypothetical protein [Bacteroidales bacterium]
MKTSILIKVLLGLPLILFVDWVLMTIFGCGAIFMGAGNDFYCGIYCFIGKGILLLSAVLFLSLFLPEIKQFIDHKKHAPTH